MTVQTLAELIAQADAEENGAVAATPEPKPEAEEVEETEQEEADTEEQSEDEGDSEAESKDETEEWAKPDTKNFVPAKIHSELRKSLRATESEAEVVKKENEQLKQRLAALEGGVKSTEVLKAPTLEECDYDNDVLAQRLAEYSEKLVEKKLRERDTEQTATAQQIQHKQKIDSEVNKHYERASALIAQGKVSEDNFKASELLVRKAFSESSNMDPDYLTDYFISVLGDGSEKVVTHLGINAAALSKLKETLKEDPSGLRTAAYLGSLNEKFKSATVNKLSNAPKPDTPLKGTANVSSGSAKGAYLKAEKAGDVSGMLAAKRAAKAKGLDTSNW